MVLSYSFIETFSRKTRHHHNQSQNF